MSKNKLKAKDWLGALAGATIIYYLLAAFVIVFGN
jgi:hypothetical protein